MPLPNFLRDTYKQYKADTDGFATWLGETAKKCAHADTDTLPTPTPILDSGSSQSKYKITLKDFIKFSEIIAKHGRIEVPQAIVGMARRAISLRRRFTDQFRGNKAGKKSHTHFVRVLEEALQILMVPDGTDSPVGISSDTPMDKANATSHSATFNPEEPIEFDAQSPANGETATTPVIEEVKYEVDDEFDDELEAFTLACFCLLDDLARIRGFLVETWEEYQMGMIDLMSASITTNTALVLGRQAIEQLGKMKDFPGGQGEFQEMLYSSICEGKGADCFTPQRPGDPFNTANFDIADHCYMVTDIILRFFCKGLKPGTVLFRFQKENKFGIYDPALDRSKMSGSEKYNEDKLLLMQALPEFLLVAAMKPCPNDDELTKGMREMAKTQKVSLWLSFAAQVYLDIHHVLRVNVGKGFQDLRLTGMRVEKIVKEHFKFIKSFTCPDPSIGHTSTLEQILAMVDFYINRDIRQRASKVPITKEDAFLFLKWHPVQAGLLMFYINLGVQHTGTHVVNAWGNVPCLAHLYNSVQNAGLVSVDWPDMDKIIEYHTEERIFIGSKPSNMKDSFKQLSKFLGMVESIGGGSPYRVKIGSHGLDETTIISKIFCDHYIEDSSIDLSVANVSSLLNDLSRAEPSKRPRRRTRASKRLKRKWQNTQMLSSLQLLTALREKLIDEEPRLIFNYFGMHQRGMELMRLIRTEIMNRCVSKDPWPTFTARDQEHTLPCLILLIFLSANDTSQPILGHAPLRTAAQVMQGFLAKNGGVACKELRAFCKNERHTKEEAKKESDRREENAQFWFTFEERFSKASKQSGELQNLMQAMELYNDETWMID